MWKWLVVFLFLPLAAWAQDLPQPLTGTVSDYDGILPATAEARLSDMLAAARAETGVHVVLVTMDRRETHAGQGRSIEDYAKALFNLWGVGDRARNDGVMILVATGDREMRVQLGSGYGSEWDGVAQGVIDTAFLPAFRGGREVEGIEQGTAAVIAQIVRPFTSGTPPPAVPSQGWSGWGAALAIPLFMLGVGLLAARRVIGDLMVRLNPCPQCGRKGGLRRERVVISPASSHSGGWGRAITTCSQCSYRSETTYDIPAQRDDDSSSGSSGGFGGGQSSGGGATGRW